MLALLGLSLTATSFVGKLPPDIPRDHDSAQKSAKSPRFTMGLLLALTFTESSGIRVTKSKSWQLSAVLGSSVFYPKKHQNILI